MHVRKLVSRRPVDTFVGKKYDVKVRFAKTVVDAFSVDLEPRHPRARIDIKTPVCSAQRAFVIADADLRYKRKNELPERIDVGNIARDMRQNMEPKEGHIPFVAGGDIEKPVGRVQKRTRVRQTLLVVC